METEPVLTGLALLIAIVLGTLIGSLHGIPDEFLHFALFAVGLLFLTIAVALAVITHLQSD